MTVIGRWVTVCLLISVLESPAARADDSLYLALGGKRNIAHFTSETIDIALKDDRIKDKFVDTSIRRLKHFLAQQICSVSGGPCVYRGRSMQAAHAKLHLDDADFNALVEDMQTAMDHADISFYTQNKLLAILAPMHRDVVTKE